MESLGERLCEWIFMQSIVIDMFSYVAAVDPQPRAQNLESSENLQYSILTEIIDR